MKTHLSLVSNSSSTSFIIYTSSLDAEMYSRLMHVINNGSNYIEPDFSDEIKTIYVSTGQSSGNECLFKWWKLKKWLVDNIIPHQNAGSGTPDTDQKVCDFCAYITEESDDQIPNSEKIPDSKKIQELKDWYYQNIPCQRIEDALEDIGLTKDDIKNDLEHGNPKMLELYAFLFEESRCQQK